MEQYLQGARINSDLNEQNWKSLNSTLDEPEANPSSEFECNICLDFVQDPVVTFCGHLYCWPCIYRWINSRDTPSLEYLDRPKPQCPVCKNEVSEKTLIPLYGRGQATNSSKNEPSSLIPQRPPSPRCHDSLSSPNMTDNHSSPGYQGYAPSYRPNLGLHGSTTHLADPMIGMFGEFVYARIFGNSETTLYTYPNSYHLAGGSSPRLRRHMVQTDESLSRVCFFLCCCVTLCLLLF